MPDVPRQEDALRAKIAPKVSALVRNDIMGNGTRYNLFDATLGKRTGDEVRALLAVAAVARRVARDWDRWDEATPETCRAFHRALARLDRASRASGRGTK